MHNYVSTAAESRTSRTSSGAYVESLLSVLKDERSSFSVLSVSAAASWSRVYSSILEHLEVIYATTLLQLYLSLVRPHLEWGY